MRRLIIVLALVLAAGLPIAALAGSNVPFKGADSGLWGEGSHDCDGLFPVFVESSGTATHVGKYSYSSQECIDLDAQTFAGVFELIAANGDRIHGTYSGSFQVVGEAIKYEQDNTVTGGTGRFASAT